MSRLTYQAIRRARSAFAVHDAARLGIATGISSFATNQYRIAAENQATRAEIADRIESVLAASTFDEAPIIKLASPRTYADACDITAKIALQNENQNSLVLHILERHLSDRVKLWRVACSLQAAHHAWVTRGTFDPDKFRDNLRSRDPDIVERTLCTFAACGEIDWRNASHRVRAAFVLNRIVTYFRDGPAP